MCRHKLLNQINTRRKEMIDVANEKGMNHKESIRLSAELDRLLNEYQKILKKDIKKTSL